MTSQKAKLKAERIAYKVQHLKQQAHDYAHTAICELSEMYAWDGSTTANADLTEAFEALEKARNALRRAGAKKEV